MCGLCGEVRFDGRATDVAAVQRMSQAMAARGPDGEGVWAQGRVAFGHRRLSIIDLSACGAQPMQDPALGLTAVFNGCIHNYPQLREELIGYGYRSTSTSDTEVVVKGYHRWGIDVVDHLVGMFAVVVHERDSGRVVLMRDRLGVKPLYLAQTPGRLRFASSLPALLAAGDVDTTIDPVALHHYLSWHAVVPAPHTVLQGVRKLPPATVRVIEADGRSREHRYWALDHVRREEYASFSEQDWEDAVLASLRTAVARRTVADVPVGVLLSGGLDSSLIAALLVEQGRTDLATYSIGFESVGRRDGDEFEYSDAIAQRFATNHHRIRVSGAELVGALGHAVDAMSEPVVSHDVVAFDLLSQQVSQTTKVVQSGQGADEVFGGYHWYPPLSGLTPAQGVDAYATAFFDRDHAGVARVLNPQWLTSTDVSREYLEQHFARPGADTAVDAALRLDTEVMLVDDPVKRVDNTTMAWGLEARVPFLDHELVELAAAIPPELQLAGGGKGILERVGYRMIPREVIDRPKGYFPVPAITHLEGEVLGLVKDALTSRAARDRALFRPGYVDGLLGDPNSELTPLRGNKLWQLGLLEMWLQQHGID